MMAAGVVFYGVEIIASTLPAALLTFVVGVSRFAALGMLVVSDLAQWRCHSRDTTPPFSRCAFISNIFFPIENPPRRMEIAGNFFPLRRLRGFRDASTHLTRPQFHLAPDPDLAPLGVGWPPPRGAVLQVGAIRRVDLARRRVDEPKLVTV